MVLSIGSRQRTKLVLLAFGVITIFISSCASNPPISNATLDKSFAGKINKILVLSLGDDRPKSLSFENLIVARINLSGSEAVAATDILGLSSIPEESLVIEAAAKTGADSVLVSRLKSADINQTQIDRPTVTTMRSGGVFLDGYHPYDFWETEEPGEITRDATVVITSELYLTENGQRVWSVDSTSFRRDRANIVIHESADIIVNKLKADGLIDDL